MNRDTWKRVEARAGAEERAVPVFEEDATRIWVETGKNRVIEGRVTRRRPV